VPPLGKPDAEKLQMLAEIQPDHWNWNNRVHGSNQICGTRVRRILLPNYKLRVETLTSRAQEAGVNSSIVVHP